MAIKVQVKLESNGSILTCWVEPKVKVGNSITLKNSDEPDKLWKVLSVSEPKDTGEINTAWRVGGL